MKLKLKAPHWLILGVLVAIILTGIFGVIEIPWVAWLLAIGVVGSAAYAIWYFFKGKKKTQ